ncbi:MAG: hypothetical protein Q9196_003592 [Gyalolechia fulgens]
MRLDFHAIDGERYFRAIELAEKDEEEEESNPYAIEMAEKKEWNSHAIEMAEEKERDFHAIDITEGKERDFHAIDITEENEGYPPVIEITEREDENSQHDRGPARPTTGKVAEGLW